jgi:hypothetical protein
MTTNSLALVPYNPLVGNARMAGGKLAQFLADNSKTIGRTGMGLTALGALIGAGEALSNPNESRLSNVVGAGGNLGGGLAGLATGTMMGSKLGPWGALAGGAIGSIVGSGALEGLGRAAVGIWEDPNAKAIRQQSALRDAERTARVKDLAAMLPYEYEAAEMKAALQQRIAAQNAELQNQQLLQQGLVQGIADRTRGQQAWDNTLAAGMMNMLA